MSLLLAATETVPVDTPDIVWSALSPFLVMVGGAILMLILGGLLPRKQRIAWGALTTIAIALGTIVAAVLLWRDLPETGNRSVVAGAYAVDGFSMFLIVVIAGQNYQAVVEGNLLQVVSSYIGLPIFLLLWLGHWLATRKQPAVKIDPWTAELH